jgi:AcrR family transcriptional regulator
MAAKASRKRARRPAAAATPASDPAARIIDATLELVAGRGWRHVSLADIASAAGLSLAELYSRYPSKTAIVAAFMARVDEQSLAGRADGGGTVRDRLFDLIMRRLDALAPHKPAVKSMLEAGPGEALTALCLAPRFLNSMRWLAEAAGVGTSGLLGMLRVKSIAAIYLATLRTWLQDDGADNGKTMAFLDRALRRAEMMARSIPGAERPAAAAD